MIFWVLVLCRALLHSHVKTGKLGIAAFFMSLGQCVLLLLPFGGAFVKLFVGYPGLSLVGLYYIFRPRDGICLVKLSAAAYFGAVLLGGSLILFERWTGNTSGIFLYLPLLAGGVVYGLYVLLRLTENYGSLPVVEAELVISETVVLRVYALWDSGNGLREPVSGSPVSLVEKEVMEPYREFLAPETCRVVPYHSIGCKKGILQSFIIERMRIAREGEWLEILRPVIGITEESISVGGEYRMILHPALKKRRNNI
ncbi:MAG: sigma-E processing peptidase SpoIIGA [Lachnospiraceae bacterium]|nr:sigma-E processing peptidase SpoIIGA [Lachnospiraceae bacterium]